MPFGFSGKSTDDIIEELINDNFSYNDAVEMANNYVYIMSYVRERTGRDNFDFREVQNLYDAFERDLINYSIEDDESGIFRIGCDFKGLKEIKEFENDQFFIPSSYYCLIKCMNKFLKLDKRIGIIETKGVDPYSITLKKFRKILIEQDFDLNELPSIFVVNKNTMGEYSFNTVDKKKQNKNGYSILLVKIEKFKFHAVLVKSNKIYLQTFMDIMKNIKFETSIELSEDQIKMDEVLMKNPKRYFYVYDIETSSKEKDGKRIQIPEGLSYSLVDMKHEPKKKDCVNIIGQDCLKDMLDDICDNDEDKQIIIFAHNGGRFDNVFIKGVEGVKLKNQIKTGGCIRKLEIQYNGKTFFFMDSCSFLQSSLKNCCKYFGTENKMDFDIVNKSHEWFLSNKEWKSYLKQDTFVLAQILFKFENYLLELGESITTNVGIASVAWRIMNKTCFGIRNMFRPKDPITQKFIKEACYGGRILHYRKYFEAGKTRISRGVTSKGLVSLDGNSLYPSAMYIGVFPVGKYKILPKIDPSEFVNEYLKKDILCIVEVTIDTRNSRYPLIPYRTEDGNLIYKSGIIKGVYTSVDLLEAMNDKCGILKIKRGIYWVRSERIFSSLIENFYNKRAQFKKEGNGMEYVLKIALNSMYGKFLEEIDTCYKFNKIEKTDFVTSKAECINGNVEYSIKLDYPLVKKPSQVAAFVLSYARKIMNNIIRDVEPENIFYGDTDSIYCTVEAASKLKTNNDLCGFKNDYGEGMVIEKAYFLDLKRYFLIFNNGTFKAKFNGICFENADSIKNWLTGDDNIKDGLEKMYRWFNENPGKICDIKIVQERWLRLTDSVSISTEEMEYQIDPNKRNKWAGGKSYPLDYDNEKIEYGLGNKTKFVTREEMSYYFSGKGLFSALPLVCKELNCNFVSIQNNILPNFKTSYVIDKKENIYLFKNEKYYSVNEYGPCKEIEPKSECFRLIAIKNDKNIYPRVSLSEINDIGIKLSKLN